MKNVVTIIMYHFVRDLAKSRYPEIKGLDLALFREQVAYLASHYHVISMEQLIDAIEHKNQLPPKSALLSFDDGYTDHYYHVLPELSAHNMQGSFYPPARAITEHRVLDVNKIHFILASVKDKNLLTQELFAQLDQYRDTYSLESNAAYHEKHAKPRRRDTAEVMFIKQMLQVVLPEQLRKIICDHLFGKYVTSDEAAFSSELYMGIDQLRELKSEGMHIGSHGYDHYWLGSLSALKQESEIDLSLKFLNQLGCDMDKWTMCYPYGDYNDDTVHILQQKKCRLSLTTHTDIADLNIYDRYRLPKLDTNEIPVNAAAITNKWFAEA